MSECFGVTMDYILKGIEPATESKNQNFNASQILYIASTAFLAIGLLCAFGGWYEEQSAESIWGSMIIQVVGIAAYFIGKLISQSKPSFIINWLNIAIASFMPISLIATFIFKSCCPLSDRYIKRFCFYSSIYHNNNFSIFRIEGAPK